MIDCPYGDLRLQLRQASLTDATLNRIINLSGVASPAQARPALIWNYIVRLSSRTQSAEANNDISIRHNTPKV